jgi:hypothetical protein
MKHTTFASFYPFYLGEHMNATCRKLHFIGTSLGLLCFLMFFRTGRWQLIVAGLLIGYAFAWLGHFGFEKNKPASFEQPLYSFMGDWKMWWQLLTRQIRFNPVN